MKDLIKYFELPNNIKTVLVVGDTNYYENTDIEVEVISRNNVKAQRLIDLKTFISKKRRLFYFKYDTIVLEQAYIEETLALLIHYFSDKNFNLIIILDSTYKI